MSDTVWSHKHPVLHAVTAILAAEGTSVEALDINEYYSYSGGEVFNDLAIEKVADTILSVEQHYTQRMDRMSDPEVRFDISDPDSWVPIEFTQHPSVYQRDEDGLGIGDFLQTWDTNLQHQFPADDVANE